MFQRLENLLILSTIAAWFYFIILSFFPRKGPLVILEILLGFLTGFLLLIFIIFFWNKVINKNSSRWITSITIIFFLAVGYNFLFIHFYKDIGVPLIAQLRFESVCKFFPKPIGSNICYKEVAFLKKDENICEKIIAEPIYQPTMRKERCYFDIAKLKNDLSICKKAGQFKESCIKTITRKIQE